MLINGDGQESRGFIHIERLTQQLFALTTDRRYTDIVYQVTDHNLRVIDLVNEVKNLNPTSEYRHVNPERKMTNQIFEPSCLEGFDKVSIKELRKDLTEFYHQFMVI